MNSLSPVPFDALASADLDEGREYQGGPQPHVGADPLPYLMGVGNSGGIRYKNVKGTTQPALCVLFSTGAVSEWPDRHDFSHLIYYGDQKTPGADIHDTPLRGNRLFADVAALMRDGEAGRRLIPPFFYFTKTGRGRDVAFEGTFVPANDRDWLTVESKSTPSGEFMNYRAELAPLGIDPVPRLWLSDLLAGISTGPSAPDEWIEWVRTGSAV